MTARARTIAVLAIVAGGAVSVISSTQTWLDVTLEAGATTSLAVPGATAFPLLAPLSLAALALGLALTVAGRVLRYVFGVIAVAIGSTLLFAAARIGFAVPLDAAASAVTEATGLAGDAALAQLVDALVPTPWPFVASVAGLAVAVGGLLTLASGHAWRSAGRRYRTDAVPAGTAPRPHDSLRDRAIDSWDDLSHGDDPTA
ncbi:MAG: Trp biosynthesis-associated membrane protein [Microbacterium sp.]